MNLKNSENDEVVEEVINNYTKDNENYSLAEKKKFKGLSSKNIVIICFLVSLIGGFLGSLLQNGFSSIFSGGTPEQATVFSTTTIGSIAEAVAKVTASVVDVETEAVDDKGNPIREAGSGLVYSSDGLIITNEHVISNAKVINVTMSNGKNYKAELIGSDADTDIALLKISAQNLTPVVFTDSDTLRKGEEIFVIGNPLGELSGSVTDGIISATKRELSFGGSKKTLIQTNAEINSGNSGGGVFKLSGELIGVVIAKSMGEGLEGLGFVIPANTVKECINKLSK